MNSVKLFHLRYFVFTTPRCGKLPVTLQFSIFNKNVPYKKIVEISE